MAPKSKGLTYGTRLRTTEHERAIVESVQSVFKDAGLAPSLNDVLRHLIRRAEIPIPRTPAEGFAAILAHAQECPDCEPYQPPRCLDGLYIRELNGIVCSNRSPNPL